MTSTAAPPPADAADAGAAATDAAAASDAAANTSATDTDTRQATYRDLFAVKEYRFLYPAKAQSDFGDYLARVALTFLVFGRSHSPALAAAAYGVTYFPWVLGPLLAVLADRRPRRSVMIVCDVARALLYAAVALPGLPTAAAIALAFVAAGCSVPFDTSRAALMPEVLAGDRYTLASGLSATTTQLAQLLGFAVGGVIVLAVHPAGALLIDAATFAVSATLVTLGVRHRPAAAVPAGKGLRSVARDMGSGIRYVFSKPLLRACLAMIWASSLFVYAFEGQVAALVQQIGAGPRLAGVLLASAPAGVALGSFLLTRLVGPARRVRLVLPLALVACGVQIVLFAKPIPAVCVVVFFTVGMAGVYSTILNPVFVRAVDPAYRGRAMGVAVAGINLAQGTAAVTAGLFARTLGAAHTIGVYGTTGAAVTLLAGLTIWRRRTTGDV